MALIARTLLAVRVRLEMWERKHMKTKSIVILLTLVATMASLAFATPGHKKKISLTEPTVVENLWLQPGEYTIEWNGTGDRNVEVRFTQGARTIATVPGRIEPAQNGHDLALILGEIDGSGTRPLVAIEMRGSTLIFS
jgi:hypothetical protein